MYIKYYYVLLIIYYNVEIINVYDSAISTL